MPGKNTKAPLPLVHPLPRVGDIWTQTRNGKTRRLLVRSIREVAERLVFTIVEATSKPTRPMTVNDYQTGRYGLHPTGETRDLGPTHAHHSRMVRGFSDGSDKPTPRPRVMLPRVSHGALTRMCTRARELDAKGMGTELIASALGVSDAVARRLVDLGRSAA